MAEIVTTEELFGTSPSIVTSEQLFGSDKDGFLMSGIKDMGKRAAAIVEAPMAVTSGVLSSMTKPFVEYTKMAQGMSAEDARREAEQAAAATTYQPFTDYGKQQADIAGRALGFPFEAAKGIVGQPTREMFEQSPYAALIRAAGGRPELVGMPLEEAIMFGVGAKAMHTGGKLVGKGAGAVRDATSMANLRGVLDEQWQEPVSPGKSTLKQQPGPSPIPQRKIVTTEELNAIPDWVPDKRGPSPIPQRKIAAAVEVRPEVKPIEPEVKIPEPKLETPEAPRDMFDALKDFGNINEDISLASNLKQSSGAPKGSGQNLVTFIESMGGVNLADFSDIVSKSSGFKKGQTKDITREIHPDLGRVSNRNSKETLDTIAQAMNAQGWGEWTDAKVYEALSSGRGRDIMRPDLNQVSPREQAKLDAQDPYSQENAAQAEADYLASKRGAGAVAKDVGEVLSGKVGMQIDLGDRIQSRLAAENRLKQDLVRWQAEAKEAGISLEKHLKGMGWGSNTDKLLTLLPADQQAQARQTPRPTIPKDATGIKVDVIAEERARRGAPEIDKPAWTTQEAWDEGQRRVYDDATYGKSLAQDIVDKPRNISAEETNALITERNRLKNEYDSYEKRIEKAIDEGDTDYARVLKKTYEQIEADWDLNDQAGMISGREWAAAGLARQNMILNDFSRAALIRRYKVDTGKPLDPNNAKDAAIIAKLTSYSDKIIDLQNQVRHFEEAKVSGDVTATVRKLVNEAAKEKRQAGRAIAKEILDNEFSSLAKAAAKAMGSQSALHSGLPVEVVSIIGKMAKNRVESGIITVEGVVDSIVTQLKNIGIDLTKREVMDAISGYGVEKKLSKEPILVTLRDLRGQMQQLAKLEDLKKTGNALRTGMERRTPSDTERALIRDVNEAKKQFGVKATTAEQLKSAQDALETRLKNSITDITKEIESGEFAKPKTGVKYEAEAARLKAYRDSLIELRESVKAAFAEAGILEPTTIEPPKEAKTAARKREITMEQRIAAAVKAAERTTARYAQMASEGDLYPSKNRRALIETPELADARQLKADVKGYLDELRDIANPKLTPDQIAEKIYKTRLTKRIAEIEGKLKSGDFATPEKKVRTLSQSELDLKYKLEEAMSEYYGAQLKWKMENRTGLAKFGGFALEANAFYRSYKTAFDLSMVLKQAGFLNTAHPLRGAKSIPDMIEALKSEKGRYAVEMGIKNDPDYHLAQKGDLFLSDSRSPSYLKSEEAYQSRWARKEIKVRGIDINPVGASERAYTALLDSVRFATFKALIKDLPIKTGEPTIGELRYIANFINTVTGRGPIGNSKGVVASLMALHQIYFAPRWVLSRFQTLIFQPVWRNWGEAGSARKLIAKEYGRYLAGYAVMAVLVSAAGGTVESDGSFKFGKRRIDMLAGLKQAGVFMARMAMGTANIVQEIRNKRKPFPKDPFKNDPIKKGDYVLGRFNRSKLGPTAGMASDVLLFGKDYTGKPIDRKYFLKQALPISFSDIQAAMKEDGIPDGVIQATLSVLGAGTQVYDQRR
jgi:hypothetical protein